jgi:thioredoxin reductase (NADPH)
VRQYETVVAIEGRAPQLVVRSRRRSGEERARRCRAVIVATGYFGTPNLLGVPGESLPHVSHVYREAHEAFEQDAVVVGGGNSAAEAALDLWRTGARVTLVHFGPTWDKRIKPWVLPDVTNRIAEEGSIAACWNARVEAIRPDVVVVRDPAGRQELPADHVYLLTGFAPDTALLRATGVEIDPDSVRDQRARGLHGRRARRRLRREPGLHRERAVPRGPDRRPPHGERAGRGAARERRPGQLTPRRAPGR